MSYAVVCHPDVARRLCSLTQAPRATVTAALDDLARQADGTGGPGDETVGTWVSGVPGTRFRVQLAYDHAVGAMYVLSLRPDLAGAVQAATHVPTSRLPA